MDRFLASKKIREYEAALTERTGRPIGGDGGLEAEASDQLRPLNHSASAPRPSRIRPAKSTAASWDAYFDENFSVSDDNGRTFNVYYTPPVDSSSPIFVFHHGMSSSGLTFALLAKRICETMRTSVENEPISSKDREIAGILSFDMRGHGRTEVTGSNADDYSLEALSNDFITMVELVGKKCSWSRDKPPSLVLVGHSLGGAVVSYAARQKKLRTLSGVVVLDAVEGPALEALKSMDQVLATWPAKFDSVERAIDWHLSSRTLRSRLSAVVSVPGLVHRQGDSYTWIIDPKATENFWVGWFTGLSANFLAAPAARLLILAGTDNLDTALMIGQMQGKYQLVVFSESGHFIQEDEPDKTALTLIDFWTRNGRPVNIKPLFGKFNNA